MNDPVATPAGPRQGPAVDQRLSSAAIRRRRQFCRKLFPRGCVNWFPYVVKTSDQLVGALQWQPEAEETAFDVMPARHLTTSHLETSP